MINRSIALDLCAKYINFRCAISLNIIMSSLTLCGIVFSVIQLGRYTKSPLFHSESFIQSDTHTCIKYCLFLKNTTMLGLA